MTPFGPDADDIQRSFVVCFGSLFDPFQSFQLEGGAGVDDFKSPTCLIQGSPQLKAEMTRFVFGPNLKSDGSIFCNGELVAFLVGGIGGQ